MNIDDLTIGEAKRLASMFGAGDASAPSTELIPGDSRPVIVRSRDAGVMYGKLVGYTPDGSRVHLTDARQMWSWTAAQGGTLADCATHGIKAGKISAPASAVIVVGACAIIDVSARAAETLDRATWA